MGFSTKNPFIPLISKAYKLNTKANSKFSVLSIVMAPRRILSSSPPIPIGNCNVTIETNKFTCKSDANSLQISLSKSSKITVSVREEKQEENVIKLGSPHCKGGVSSSAGYSFLLVNPNDVDHRGKYYLQEVLEMYKKELPTMNYAANSGSKSMFMEKCVFNGKYCTLLLISTSIGESGQVIGAITYQIIPADTQFAEIPLAVVSSTQQHKGFGKKMYTELRRRLENVGIRSIFCWGDKESEGFWFKQGFVLVGEVDNKGRAHRLPIKANIRRALCFLGCSTLMISHIRHVIAATTISTLNLCSQLKPHEKSTSNTQSENQDHQLEHSKDGFNSVVRVKQKTENDCQKGELLVTNRPSVKDNGICHQIQDPAPDCRDTVSLSPVNCKTTADIELPIPRIGADMEDRHCSCSTQGVKRVWEASITSLKSKKVKGSHPIDCQTCNQNFGPVCSRNDSCLQSCSFDASNDKFLRGFCKGSSITNCEEKAFKELGQAKEQSKALQGKRFAIMLMNIADEDKQNQLTKVIKDLSGSVTSDGSTSTHVVTGKVRKTQNFCAALCTGAWIVSPIWLKESFRKGRFVDELPYILNDGDYLLKYKLELKTASLRARSSPGGFLKGYNIYISARVQPPVKTLSTIVRSAGGNIISGLEKTKELRRTIFVACEDDLEEALVAVKKGIWTFSSDWLMNCVMRQELDLEASQFAESL